MHVINCFVFFCQLFIENVFKLQILIINKEYFIVRLLFLIFFVSLIINSPLIIILIALE